MMTNISTSNTDPLRNLLLIDDQRYWLNAISYSLQAFPLKVSIAVDADEAFALIQSYSFDWIVCDLRLDQTNGVELIQQLKIHASSALYLLLTGYGSVANTVFALKQGVHHVAQKPLQATEIISLFLKLEQEVFDRPYTQHIAKEFMIESEFVQTHMTPIPQAASLATVEWEHIQRVLEDCQGNISRAARVLGIHRRTLQRKLNMIPSHSSTKKK